MPMHKRTIWGEGKRRRGKCRWRYSSDLKNFYCRSCKIACKAIEGGADFKPDAIKQKQTTNVLTPKVVRKGKR